MGYFHAKQKTRITAVALTLGIVLLVTLVGYLPVPWRGLVDCGVVLGLSYGILSFAALTAQVFYGKGFNHSPEVP